MRLFHRIIAELTKVGSGIAHDAGRGSSNDGGTGTAVFDSQYPDQSDETHCHAGPAGDDPDAVDLQDGLSADFIEFEDAVFDSEDPEQSNKMHFNASQAGDDPYARDPQDGFSADFDEFEDDDKAHDDICQAVDNQGVWICLDDINSNSSSGIGMRTTVCFSKDPARPMVVTSRGETSYTRKLTATKSIGLWMATPQTYEFYFKALHDDSKYCSYDNISMALMPT